MNKSLQAFVKSVGERLLLPHGFDRVAAGKYSRKSVCLEQVIHIFQHRDRFSLRVFWRYLNKSYSVADGYDFATDLENFIESPGWFSVAKTESLDEARREVETAIDSKILPFLNRFQDVASIVSGFERGELNDRVFGLDPLRKLLMMAACFESSGKKSKARKLYKDAIDYSAQLDDLSPEEELWVEEARRRLR